MKRILILTFYYEPDFCAGSFRNTPLANEIASIAQSNAIIDVITTQPNRYQSFKDRASSFETHGNLEINRIDVPTHKSGFFDQIKSFAAFYFGALKLIKGRKYDLVYASSSRLFTAYLGKKIAQKNHCPYYIDVRDIFVETMQDVLPKIPILKPLLLLVLGKFIEKPTFNSASHINLVSKGFESYFSNFNVNQFSYYPNGIDDVFINLKQNEHISNSPKVITYAGNIGEGQGLEKIIPLLAKKLGNNFMIKIIGDGGTKQKLQNCIDEENINNVQIINPVKRDQLIHYYKNSHYLFLHLNSLAAFEKVLPSKIFEYGALDLPIIAGVSGYAATFINQNITNCFVTNPCNADAIVDWILRTEYKLENRDDFIDKYSRKRVTTKLANSILSYLK